MKQSVETSELLKYRVQKCVPERTKQIIQVCLHPINCIKNVNIYLFLFRL